MDVGQNTTLGNGDVSEQLVQLLVVADGELEVTGDDTGLLVVTSGVAGQLEDLGSQVLQNGGEVDRGTSTDTLGVVALAEKTVDTTNWEGQTGLGGAAVMESVAFGKWSGFNALFWIAKARQSKPMVMDKARNGCDSRLSIALGTRGLSARLAASHFDVVGVVEKLKG